MDNPHFPPTHLPPATPPPSPSPSQSASIKAMHTSIPFFTASPLLPAPLSLSLSARLSHDQALNYQPINQPCLVLHTTPHRNPLSDSPTLSRAARQRRKAERGKIVVSQVVVVEGEEEEEEEGTKEIREQRVRREKPKGQEKGFPSRFLFQHVSKKHIGGYVRYNF